MMNIINFTRELMDFPAYSITDASKLSGKVYHHRFVDWQKKGYIKRVANGVYIFADANLDEIYLFYLANRVYAPAYISLESALSYYGFIPESVYQITSVSTRKTYNAEFDDVTFSFRTINQKYYFGYILQSWKNTVVKIAEPEKALIDYFYLNPEITTLEQIEALRLNPYEILGKVNWGRIAGYLTIYNSNALQSRIQLLGKWMKENA